MAKKLVRKSRREAKTKPVIDHTKCARKECAVAKKPQDVFCWICYYKIPRELRDLLNTIIYYGETEKNQLKDIKRQCIAAIRKAIKPLN